MQKVNLITKLTFMLAFLVMSFTLKSQQSVINPADPVVTYNPAVPPIDPAIGQIGKWVRTVRMTWNTTAWKCYVINGIPFRLKFPKTYQHGVSDGKRYPMVSFFHGMGERGTKYDNEYSLANGGNFFNNSTESGLFDGYVIVMQSTGGWLQSQYDALKLVIDYMVANNKLDPFAVSANGLSSGGYATWDIFTLYPQYITGSFPMSGISIGLATNTQAKNNIKFSTFWYFQGGLDKSPDPNTMYQVKDALEASGAKFRYTLYPNLGHGTWNSAWADPDFLPSVKRVYASNPYALFGRTEFCPGDPINVTVGVPPGHDEYKWRKDGIEIIGAVGNSIQVNSVGVYEAQIRKGTVWSEWSRIPVVIKIKQPTVTPPISVEGLRSKVIPSLSEATTVLQVPEGYVSYEWRKIGSNNSIGNGNKLVVSSAGDYIVKVNEQYGCSSDFSAPFTVINANGSPKPEGVTNLVVSTLSKTSLKLDWNQNSSPTVNETNFEVYQSSQAGGPYSLISITQPDVSTLNVINLNANSQYYFLVRAVGNSAAGKSSNEASGKTAADLLPPTTPALSLGTTTRTSVSLNWTAATDDVAVVGYDVYVNGVKSYFTTETQLTINELEYGKSYNFKVSAKDFANNISPLSNQVTGQPLLSGLNYKYFTYTGTWNALPNFALLTPVTTGRMSTVAITPRTQNDRFAFLWEGYLNITTPGSYTFRTNSDDGSRLYIGSKGQTTSPYNFSATPLVNNDGLHGAQNRDGSITLEVGVYPIAISFYEQSGGESMTVSWLQPNTTTFVTIPSSSFAEPPINNGTSPIAPSNLVASPVSYNGINLTWLDNSDNETGFEISRSTSQTGLFQTIATTSPNISSYSDNTVQANTTYYYKIRAIGLYGESALVSKYIVETAKWTLNNSLTDVSGNNRNLTAFNGPVFDGSDKIEGTHAIRFNGTNQYLLIPNTSSYLQTAYSELSVAFWMKSTNNTGNRVILDIGGNDDGLALRLDANLLYAGIAANNSRFNFSVPFASTTWNHIALVYKGNSLKLYLNGVEVASNNALSFSATTSTSNRSAIGRSESSNAFNTGTGLFSGLIDNFIISSNALTAADVLIAMNNGSWQHSSAKTLTLPSVPQAPTALNATSVNTNSITLGWTDNANDETNYELYRSSNNNANYILIGTLESNITSFVDDNLFANSNYYYKVRALNAGGSSSYTNELQITTGNNSPQIDPIANRSARYGVTTIIPITAIDSDGGTLTFTLENQPAFVSLVMNSGQAGLQLEPTSADQGVYNGIKVNVSDANGGTAFITFDLTVNDNFDPQTDEISNVSVNENQTLNIALTASDQNVSDILSWSVENLPDNFSLTNGQNGSATLVFTPTFAASGTYNARITVSDGNGGSSSKTFTVVVNDVNINTKVYSRVKYANSIGSPWNSLNGPTTNNLLDDSNSPTNIGISFQTPSWWRPFSGGATTGNNSGVYPDAVLNDYYYFGFFGGPETVDVTISGLNPALPYDLTFFASSVYNGVPDNGSTNYTVGTKSASLNVQNNTANTASLKGLQPDANGRIVVTMSKGANTPIGYLNALVIETAFDDGSVPAMPKSLSLQNVSGQGVKLTWDDVAYNESGYEVYRSIGSSSVFTLISTTSKNINTFIDGEVSGSTTYNYKLRAINQYGNSPNTEFVSITTINRIPSIAPISDQRIKNNESVNIDVIAVDDPTDQLVLKVENLPSFATFIDFGNGTGRITMTPTAGLSGIFKDVKITATDNSDSSRTLSFTIFVVDPNISNTYISFTNSSNTSSAPWNDMVIPWLPFSGTNIANLKDDGGVNTGVSLTLTDEWTGVSLTGLKSGTGEEIYPESALRAAIYANDNNNRRITINGLNPLLRYNFVFMNSHSYSEDVSTSYSIGSQSVILNGSYNNSKTVQLNGVTPNAGGQVVINVSRVNGSAFALLSSMVIQAYNPNSVTIISPADLRVTTSTSNAISLQWQDRSANESNFEVWRSQGSGTYSLIATLPSNSTVFTNTGLAPGMTYNYFVRAVNATDAINSNAIKGYTYSSRVFINFNTTYSSPSPWNNLNWKFGIGAFWNNFLNEKGQPTNIGMVQPVYWDGMVDLGVRTGNNSGIYPDNVMAEGFGLFPGVTSYVKVKGLNVSKLYDFSMFSSIANIYGESNTLYTINGKTVLLNGTNNRSSAVMIKSVKPNENGEVDVYVTGDPQVAFALLNAMVINEYVPSNSPVPPPVTNSIKAKLNNANNLLDATSANNSLSEALLKVYPNPVINDFTLSIPAKKGENVTISIVDVSGRIVYNQNISNLNEGQNITRINADRILTKPGIYFINVIYLSSNKHKILQIIKSR